MDEEFPGVVDLNVCGTHYRTLLSTLTRDEDSILAAMFTGRHPVYKDKDGRYFIEADGLLFNAILHYLRYDELPFQEASYSGAGFGFGGGLRARSVFGDHQNGYTARNIEMLYRDALNLGLRKLAGDLQLFQPNFVNIKMDEYRKSVRGYESCLNEVLNVIPAESLFHKTEFTLRIKQDLQTIAEGKCCEHECKMMPLSTFGQPFYTSIDALVNVTFEVNPTVLSALAIDLQKRGYSVQGRMTVCGFDCKKEVKKSKYIVFTGQTKNCCVEELFLLTFKWDNEGDVVTHQNIFGPKQPFGPTRKGLFGEPVNSGFAFSNSAQKQTGSVIFGGAQQGSFGQELSSGFGSTPPSFGSTPPSFGSTPQQGEIGSSSCFGKAQQGNFGQGQSFSFGTQKQQGTFGQGSAASFGSSQEGAFSQAQSTRSSSFGQGSGFNFGGTGTSQGIFGQSQTSLFSSPQKQGTVSQGSSFGFGASQQQHSTPGKQVQQRNGFFFNAPVTQQQGSNPFGSISQTSKQQGFGLFGSSTFNQQQTSPGPSTNKSLFGGSTDVLNENEKAVFGSSKKSPASSGFSFGSPQKTQTAFSGKGAKPGPPQSSQSLFGGTQNNSQHVFGGSPTFENKFGGLTLRQSEPEQSTESVTTTFESPSNTLFGNKPETDDNAHRFEFGQEQSDKVE